MTMNVFFAAVCCGKGASHRQQDRRIDVREGKSVMSLNKFKSKFVLMLALALVVALILPMAGISAASAPSFVALGDSTGFGLSAFPVPEVRDISTISGFNDQFAAYLTGIFGTVSYTNMALPGDKTGHLLAKLQLPVVRTQVRNARIMTVSIGGNNLLGPAIEAIFGLWGVNPADYSDPDGKDMLDALAAAIAAKYAANPAYNPMDDFARLMDLTDPAAIAFQKALLRGVADFKKEWPDIASQIRQLNRRGELYVTTVHNPLQISSSSDPLYPLYLQFETLLGVINFTIRAYALTYGYRVVDANRVIRSTPGAVDFDIAGAIAAATLLVQTDLSDPLYPVYYLAFLQKTDPHPTFIGHTAIYQQLVNRRRNTPSWYWLLR